MVSSFSAKVIPKECQPYVAHWQQKRTEKRKRIKQRHVEGLKKAKELADILKADFCATKVVLFGSMLSVNDIRMKSDIDLAVWDLPSGKYFTALSALMSNAGEFSIDLVQIEEAPQSLKEYIDTQGRVLGQDVPESDELTRSFMHNHAVLIGRIKRELDYVALQYAEVQEQLTVAKQTDQNAYWMAVSLGLHGIYTGIEKIFEQIARGVDDHLSSGKQWHKDLLEQMATEIPGVRTAVINSQTLEALSELLSFRHVVRSNYAYRLEPQKIEANFHRLDSCYDDLVRQLNQLCDFLSAVN